MATLHNRMEKVLDLSIDLFRVTLMYCSLSFLLHHFMLVTALPLFEHPYLMSYSPLVDYHPRTIFYEIPSPAHAIEITPDSAWDDLT